MTQKLYEKLNQNANYESTLKRIVEISRNTCGDNKYDKFFNSISKIILESYECEKKIREGIYFSNDNIYELDKQNQLRHREIYHQNYNISYANPSYCADKFGNELGQILSYYYIKNRSYIDFVIRDKKYMIEEYNSLFIKIYEHIKSDDFDYYSLRNILVDFENRELLRNYEVSFGERFSSEYDLYNNIIQNSDLSEISYLYKFGISVNDMDVKYSKFIFGLSEDKINKISGTVVGGFLRSFSRDNKDRKKRNTVRVIYNLGEERIIKRLIEDFNKEGILVNIQKPISCQINKQYSYDHRFDNAIYVDDRYINNTKEMYKKAAQNSIEVLGRFCGSIYFERFGESPFNPEEKSECLKLSKEQTALIQSQSNALSMIIEEYIPDNQVSFCIIAFPTPEIGDEFEAIYEGIYEINTLDSGLYEKIQDKIIEVLDLGNYVWIKGNGKNKTDIKVKLHTLENPSSQTNFQNCLADVNIPLGEVFTSPVLKGTNGILHLESVYLNDLEFKELYIEFEDGYTKRYTCKNFDDEDKNQNYIKENLLYPHDSLPIGEFAIGTNTLAYSLAKKYNIVNILPVLIVEKMGPHFAIGDTCYSHSEDNPVFNSCKKQIIAVDNERSILRKTDIDKAYTNVHTDITIPYHDLKFISVILPDGSKKDIICDGKFVLKGTESLNEALNYL